LEAEAETLVDYNPADTDQVVIAIRQLENRPVYQTPILPSDAPFCAVPVMKIDCNHGPWILHPAL
jgi:hypothetical protein